MSTIGIIAGMHRSGTSALSRVMNLLGYDIPGELDMNTNHNATGHWEPADFVALNIQIIAELGSDWCDLRLPESTRFDAIASDTHQRIAAYADISFGHNPLTVLKDPRVCYTLPLWIDEVRRRNHTCIVLLPYRHPVEVAKSLAARDEMPLNSGLALWLCCMLSAEYYSRAERRCAVGFGTFISDWRTAYVSVAALTGANIPGTNEPLGMQIDGFVNREQRHHTILELTDELRALSLIDLALEAYALFEQPLDDAGVRAHFDALREHVQEVLEQDGLYEANRSFAVHYRHFRAIEERNQIIATLRREMAEINKIAQEIANERETLKVSHTDLMHRFQIIQQRQKEEIELLDRVRITQKIRIDDLTQEIASALAECDWRRATHAAYEAEVVWLRTVVASQEHLLSPIRPLLRLWEQIMRHTVRRSSDTHRND